MAKRDWNALQWIAYYYIAFAIFTDREYSDSEKEMIGAKLLRFTGGDETKLGYCINTLTECQKWIGEDIKNSTSDNDIVNNNLGKISAFLKNKLEDRHHKYIILDLIAIAKADGKFTDKEKGWIELVGNQLGINTEDIISKAMREMENTNDSPVLEKQQETKAEAIEEKIEQFWTEADSLLNTAKSPSYEIYHLIAERLDWSKLSKYDTQFNLKQEPGDENLATHLKEKIINNLWNPLFKKATTFDEYSYLLNWVIPCDKRYPFCSDYKLTNTLYDVLAQVVDENTSSSSIISVLRPEEFYDVWDKKYSVFDILAEYFVKNGDAEELAGYLKREDEHFVVIKNIVSYNIHSPFLNKVKTAFEESEWKEMLDLLEIDAEDIEDSIKNLKKKDDPVSLKEESDKTPKTEKQISTADKGANSASETDDKKKTEKESAEKKVPIWKLIQQTIESMDGKAEKKEIINHLLGEHSHLKKNTLQCQVTICTVNNPTRINWAQNKKPRTERNQYDFLYQTDKKMVVMYDPKEHGKWGIVEDKDGKMMVTKLAN